MLKIDPEIIYTDYFEEVQKRLSERDARAQLLEDNQKVPQLWVYASKAELEDQLHIYRSKFDIENQQNTVPEEQDLSENKLLEGFS